MQLSDFLAELLRLHVRAKAGTLSKAERLHYEQQREELAQALLNAQKLTPRPDETARQALRAACALPLEVSTPAGKQRSITVEISSYGCSTLLGDAPFREHDLVQVRLSLPGGQPLEARAKAMHVLKQPFNVRVGLLFDALDPPDQERLQLAVFDVVLEKLRAR
jgi:hypothetical protein